MNDYQEIEHKLQQFYRKFYVNELIKGGIIFTALGVLYFLITLFIEYALWLNPFGRTLLFWSFVCIELFLVARYMFYPLAKLFKFTKGISLEESSTIIGNHFPEVHDRLLNILQLKNRSEDTDLILASISQKSAALKPIPFAKAIDFKTNKKYLPLLSIPFVVWSLFYITGMQSDISQSLSRVVNYTQEYTPPAPFAFQLADTKLTAIQGSDYRLHISTLGSVVPSEATIHFDNETYFLSNNSLGVFSFLFENVQNNTNFYVEANGVQSPQYTLSVIKTPTLKNISVSIQNPTYTQKPDTENQAIGNFNVPEGAVLTWKVATQQADSVHFTHKRVQEPFEKLEEQTFQLKKQITSPMSYQISSSNMALKNYEQLGFSVSVIKDEYPKIQVQENIDSLVRNQAIFAGQISDDYGLTKLQVVYYEQNQPTELNTIHLDINRASIQPFILQFPDNLGLAKGKTYELFFQVYDNDAVNGAKKTISKTFMFNYKSDDKIAEELLEEQKEVLNTIEQNLKNQDIEKKALTKIQDDLKDKKDVDWNDKKNIENFIERQKQYKEMMQRQTEQLQENLLEKETTNKNLQEQKEQLQKRLEELQQLQKEQDLLKELEKLANKLNKDQLIRKTKELAAKNKQQERSLERILELTKRFYVEEKTMQLSNALEKLAQQQDSLQQQEAPKTEKQEELNKTFDALKKELEELSKENDKLKEPMDIPKLNSEKQEVEQEMKNASENLKNNKKQEAKQRQKNASKKLRKMSQQLQQSMLDMQANMIDENIDDMRKILENMVRFSFKQEDLMQLFDARSVDHPSFGKDLKSQNELKTYFEHIDDSLYVLSMRVPSISANIEKDLSDAHYNLDQSLENFTESRFNSGVANQRYVMTAVNNLADFLSNIMNSMQQSAQMSSKGNKNGKSFSLPDIIKQQQGLSKKMEQGTKKGEGKEKKGSNSPNGKQESEDLNGELYQIYQEQSQLRQQLENALKKGGGQGNKQAKDVLKTMEQLENQLLEKGFTKHVLQQMRQLEYQLLKLDKAAFEQNTDTKRKSTTALQQKELQKIKRLALQKQFYNQIEILNRQSLPLQEKYKKKVQEYFSKQ